VVKLFDVSVTKQYQSRDAEKQIAILRKLGFTEDEARIYHVLLVSKESTVGEISRSINFSRAKIYGVIDNLLAEGVVVEGNKHPKSYYPIDPKEIAERRMAEIEHASKSVKSDLSPLYKSKPVDYLETLTVKDMEIFSQVVTMCERADLSIDVIASILPSEMPRKVCRAFSDASARGVKVRMLFPKKETTLDLSRLDGFFEIRLSASMPPAGIILVDEKEFCVGGLDVPDSSNMLLGMWLNQSELARLARVIFDNIYEAAEEYNNSR
jgi:sugar-specific transcriptional regulator TrmB